MRTIAAAASLLHLGLVSGCAREFSEHDAFPVLESRLARRATTFPPQLTEHESILSSSFSGASIDTWSYYYTHGDHIAGRNKSQAQWTADRWTENGIPSSLTEYYVYLNYPKSASISLTLPNGTVYTPKLIEDPLEQDPVTTAPNAIPAFHGYSASGNATAEYVYVGRGQMVDFERLVALGVQLKGKIALAKYGGPFRGLKVKNAQSYGMIGAVIFTDPGDDGNVTEANGYAAYPLGPARNPSSIQRGSVQFLSTYPGDPTTPGYPSKRDSPRADKSPVTPSIPSLPISFRDAIPLLAALDGHGPSGTQVNRTNWIGKLNVTYSTGPAPGAVISMANLMEDTYTPIWNAIGVINGTNADETIVIGNHRDAWIIGGAADPNSGSAVMIELSKAFGKLLATGWKPKRNIVMASWDAEEYGLVGSTEWVEEYTPWLVETAIVNLNIDVAVSGPRFGISATPELHTIAMEIMQKIVYPEGGNRTLYDIWGSESGRIGVLGSGSDYTSFLHRGVAAIDMGAGNGANDAVYMYHSMYDGYAWMATHGDPGFKTHAAVGQYLGLLAYHLSSDTVIPYNVSNYAIQMRSYFQTLQTAVGSSGQSINLSAISSAIDTFAESARQVKQLETFAVQTNNSALITVVNHKYRDFSRGFISQGGLPGRPGDFYRHVVFAPGLDTGYAPVTFPGVAESLTAKNYTAAQAWVKKTADGILRAAAILKT